MTTTNFAIDLLPHCPKDRGKELEDVAEGVVVVDDDRGEPGEISCHLEGPNTKL